MPEQSLKEKTAKGLLWGAINNGVQQILVLAFGIILGRLLSPSEYGMVGMLTIFTLIGNSLQESGFRAALVNLKEIRHEDYNAVFWCSTFIGIAAYLILFFCAPLIARFYGEPELLPYLPDSCNSLLLAFFIMASNIAYRFQSAETSFFIQQQNFDN